MERLKSAIETLESSVGNLEQALAARLGTLEESLKATRSDLDRASNKAKNSETVGTRLDEVINQLESILGNP